MKLKTICPYCDCPNDFDFPTYEENLNSLQEILSNEAYSDIWEESKEEVDRICKALKSGNKKSNFDIEFITVTPIFCNECKNHYYYNPIAKTYDYEAEEFTTQSILRKLKKLSNIKDIRPCYVYFLYNPEKKLTKIGYTRNIKKRQCELEVGLTKTILKFKIETTVENAPRLEALFHTLFSTYHIKGEWYSLSSEMLEKLARRENLVQSIIAEGKSYSEVKAFIINGFMN